MGIVYDKTLPLKPSAKNIQGNVYYVHGSISKALERAEAAAWTHLSCNSMPKKDLRKTHLMTRTKAIPWL